jgi:hypothetical protein
MEDEDVKHAFRLTTEDDTAGFERDRRERSEQ